MDAAAAPLTDASAVGGGRLAACASVVALLLVTGCGSGAAPQTVPAAAADESSAAAAEGQAPGTEPAPVSQGRLAASQRVRFVPEEVTLPGGASARVESASTVDGELVVPEDVEHVGWWDGSAYAGDPFGATVIAGHVDSATQGVGFFARLLRVGVGDLIVVTADEHRAKYRVTAVETVAKQALATDGRAFTQTGDHRLVLITCTGAYVRDRGGYSSNLVLIATPVGPVR